MIYIKVKDKFGVSYGAFSNVFTLKKYIKKYHDMNYKGNTLKEHLKALNAERITSKEYYKILF